MKRALGILVLALAGCQSSAKHEWVNLGYGPPLEYAQAQCNIAAMGVGTNTVAVGSPGYVAGAMIGGAIATGIQQAEFKKNCMTLQGWKEVVKGTPPAPRKEAMTAEQRKDFVAAMAIDRAANSCSITLKSDKKAMISEVRKVSTSAMIAEAKQEAATRIAAETKATGKAQACKKLHGIIKDLGWV